MKKVFWSVKEMFAAYKIIIHFGVAENHVWRLIWLVCLPAKHRMALKGPVDPKLICQFLVNDREEKWSSWCHRGRKWVEIFPFVPQEAIKPTEALSFPCSMQNKSRKCFSLAFHYVHQEILPPPRLAIHTQRFSRYF